jgi:hypothetical protein
VIVRADINRVRETGCGPGAGDELAVDAEAVAHCSVDYALNVSTMAALVPFEVAISAAWSSGFMAGVRAAREDS